MNIWTIFRDELEKQVPLEEPWGAPPAAEAVAAFESKIGVAFPEDFRAYLMAADRPDILLCAPWYFMPLSSMNADWDIQKQLVDQGYISRPTQDDEHNPQIKNDYFNLKWVPFIHNGSGDFHCIDLDPAPGGVVGQVISYFHDRGDRRLLANSITEYFEILTREIQQGNLTPATEGGEKMLAAKEGSDAARIFAW